MRFVFCGMDGGFSTVLLTRLVARGYRPALVVQGLDRALEARGPVTERIRAGLGWFPNLRGAPAIPEPGDPVDKDLTRLARAFGVDVLRTTDANAPRARAQIAKAKPEALVVAGFPQLLAPEVLGLASRGGLNVHPGKLPEERGPSPLFWALKAGRTRFHFTIHVLDAGEDTGDVVSEGVAEVEPGLDGEDVLTILAETAAEDLVRALEGLARGDLARTPQPASGASRKPRPTFPDGQIDPERSAVEVFTFVSGCARTHSLFLDFAGDRFFVAGAESYDAAATSKFEYVLTGDRLILRCNPGVVELVLKPDGALFASDATTDHQER